MLTAIYTFVYFLAISIPLIYIAIVYYLKDGQMFQNTFTVIYLLQYATVMIIFYSAMIDLMINRQMFVNFINHLVEVDSNLVKLNAGPNYSNDLSSLHKQHILVVFLYAAVHTTSSILDRDQMSLHLYVWNVLQFFQIMSLTLIGYYIRCFALILVHRCKLIFEYLDLIRDNLLHTNCRQEHLLEPIMKCFESFDDLMNLKKQLSKLFGVQLLLNSACDFIILTISVYGMIYFVKENTSMIFYFAAFNLPHGIKCVLLVVALDQLAEQVGLCIN